MISVIYPASDAIFYIETRTPKSDSEWTALEAQTQRLSDTAAALATDRFARDRDRWMADAKLLVDASATALKAVKARDVAALVDLNDAMYQSCTTCHAHYRQGYGARAAAPVWTPPKTADGQPDLQGVWGFATLTPLERPQEFADKPFLTQAEADAWVKQTLARNDRDRRDGGADVDVGRAVNDYWFERGDGLGAVNGRIRTSLVIDPPDGRIPALTGDARAKQAARNADNRAHQADGPENRSLQERCLVFNAGPPMLPGPYNNYVQIFQTRDHVVVFNEMIHDARVIPLDSRPHAPETFRLWQGDSRGRWDGATLVVDTTNFTDKAPQRGSDERLHLTERFTRVGANQLLYEFTVENPGVFAAPWTVQLPMTLTQDRLFEYACHEGNYALQDILRGARYQERSK
jgi:hypothetical protein